MTTPAESTTIAETREAAPAHRGTRQILLSARDVTIHRGGRPLLEDVHIEIARGEIVTLVGPNGAGKTTLVRVLLGLTRPDRGSVWRRSGIVIGYAPQRLDLDPALPLTAARFLRLARPLGRAQLEARLAEVGLSGAGDRQVRALSGGEFHRLLLARALLRDPDLLVLDEPLTGVDLAGQIELYRLIADTRERRGCGILLVSHDLHLVLAASDRVFCLDRRMCCVGTPLDVARDPAFQRLFGSGFAQAFAPYRHLHDERGHGRHGEAE